MNFTSLIALIAAVGSFAFAEPIAEAAFITGEIGFSGAAHFDSTDLATVTQVVTWRDAVGNLGFLSVSDTVGDFTSIALGTDAAMNAPWILNAGLPHLWSVGGFTFDLTSATVVTQNSSFLDVSGKGIISGNGFSPTNATFAFSTQSAGGTMQQFFTVSANNVAVPDGGSTVMLLGAGLTMIGMMRRFLIG